MDKVSLALVVPNLLIGGGVTTVAGFIHEAMLNSELFDVDLISLSTSSADPDSVRLRVPSSWRSGPRISEGEWYGHPYRHFGSSIAEVELARYLPRRQLTQILNGYDLVQMVAGTPAWAYIARDVSPPVALQVATRTAVERERRHKVETGIIGGWRRIMTRAVTAVESRALRCTDLVFVENQWMHDYVAADLGEDRVVFAPPGVDTDVFRPGAQPSSRDDFILSVGRFADPRKNLPLLFHAYRLFRDQIPDAPPLVLAGKSAPSTADRSMAEDLGLDEHIIFRQGVSQDDLVDLYQNCSMFVLSSDEEGFGMVIPEAMACGAPVISTRSGGPDTIIDSGRDGYLTSVGDADELASRMIELWNSPEKRQRFAENARQTAVERFSLRSAGRVFVERLRELAEGGTGASSHP